MSRDFRTDFLLPAIQGLSREDAMRVSLALDAAICFGALAVHDGEKATGLLDRERVEAQYQDKVRRLNAGKERSS